MVLFYKIELTAICEISAQQMITNQKKNSEVVMQRQLAAYMITQPVPGDPFKKNDFFREYTDIKYDFEEWVEVMPIPIHKGKGHLNNLFYSLV